MRFKLFKGFKLIGIYTSISEAKKQAPKDDGVYNLIETNGNYRSSWQIVNSKNIKSTIMKLKELNQLKKGEYFRFKGKKKVYEFEGGGKVKGYRYTWVEDFCSEKTTKNGLQLVEVDFGY